jgi:peptide/nickel transport system permease protein
VIQGDMGTSMQSGRPVAQEILYSLPPTLELALAAMVIAILLGFSTGILAALMRNTWGDTAMTGIALFGISMPNFWLGLMLIFVFSIHLHWLPVGGTGGFERLILPAITLGFSFAGSIARLTRSSMLEVLDQDYVRTARAKGAHTWGLVMGHAFRNALLPVVTVLGLQLGQLLAGTVVVEFVFARQGLGSLILASILTKDFQVVQIGILFAAVVYVATNLVVDVLYTFIDPRIRRA